MSAAIEPFDWRSASPREQACHWERKLDLLLRLEAEALVERLGTFCRETAERKTNDADR